MAARHWTLDPRPKYLFCTSLQPKSISRQLSLTLFCCFSRNLAVFHEGAASRCSLHRLRLMIMHNGICLYIVELLQQSYLSKPHYPHYIRIPCPILLTLPFRGIVLQKSLATNALYQLGITNLTLQVSLSLVLLSFRNGMPVPF